MNDKVALITGASSGIGRATGEAFAARGAEKGAILRTVLKHAAKLSCYGIAVGLVLSMIFARLVTSMLVGVRPMDPVSLGLASSLLLLTALVAALAPGWRATHVDPIVALRAE